MDVFVSYSSANKITADAIVASLERSHIRCFYAPRDITPGAPYAEQLLGGIRGARVMVVVVSSGSLTSNHVLSEVERAIHYGLYVMPFRIEDVQLAGSLELFLSSRHWLDAVTPPLEAHIDRLRAAIERTLGFDAVPAPEPAMDASASVPPPSQSTPPLAVEAEAVEASASVTPTTASTGKFKVRSLSIPLGILTLLLSMIIVDKIKEARKSEFVIPAEMNHVPFDTMPPVSLDFTSDEYRIRTALNQRIDGDSAQRAFGDVVDTLPSNTVHRHDFAVEAGGHYLVVGICLKVQCKAAEISVYDRRDTVNRYLEGLNGVIRFTAERKAIFAYDINMKECAADNCVVGVSVARRTKREGM